MKFSKTTEYAIRVMVFLSDHRDALYSANKLHHSLKVPYKYLSRLMSKLAAAGLVESVQGKQGGFRICPACEPIYLYQIIDVVDGLSDYNRCVLGFEECSDENPCSLHNVWLPHLKGIKDMLYNVNLQDLANKDMVKY